MKLMIHPTDNKNPEKSAPSVIHIDPRMARRVLQKNTRNRRISELHVNRLMDEMATGRWQFNGDAIRWSVDDELLDGQHRLTALSRMPDHFPALPFLVVRGLPPESQDTMDQGRTRSAADQMQINNLIDAGADAKLFAGAIRVFIQWQGGGFFGDQNPGRSANRITNPQVVRWAQDHPLELMLLGEISHSEFRRIKARPALVLGILLGFTLIDGEAEREFTEALATGRNLDVGNPILTLRDRLDRIKQQGFKTSDRDIIAFFIIAWNAWRQGRSMTKFQRPHGGVWSAENFPKAI